MESYLMMLYVTLDQESALKSFFVDQGWAFCKPDLSVTTDRLGSSTGPLHANRSCTRTSPRLVGKRKAETDQHRAPVVKTAKILHTVPSMSSNIAETDCVQTEQLDVAKETELFGICSSIDGGSSVSEDQGETIVKVETFDVSYSPDECDEEYDDDTDIDYEEAKTDDEEEPLTVTEDKSLNTLQGDIATDVPKATKILNSGQIYKCDECSATYPKKYRLNQHVRLMHMGIVAAHPCSYCEATFLRKSSRVRHESIVHFGLLKHICEDCGKGCANKRLLDGHIRSVHKPETKFRCDICDSTFAFLYNLQAHNRICGRRHGKKCEICNEKFSSVMKLDVHLQTMHDVNRDIVCKECSRTFSSNKCLASHVKYKHGDCQYEYVCEVCGEKYKYPASLFKHKSIKGHLGKKEPGEL